jgi:integrase
MIKGLYEKRGYYYWQPPQKNRVRPKPIALRTKDYNEAVQKYDQVKKDLELGHAISKDSMSDAIKDYIKAKKAETKPATNIRAEGVLTKINQQMSSPKLKDITHSSITKWRDWKSRQDGYGKRTTSDSTIDTYIRIIKAFLNWCVEEKKLSENPAKRIKLGRVKKTKQTEYCTIEQRDLLLKNPPSEEISFILHFGFYAGLRFGEMLAMEKSWIHLAQDKKTGFLAVQKTKHWEPKDKELRKIKLHPELIKFIDSYGLKEPFMLAPYRKDWKPAPTYRFNPKKSFATYMKKCGVPFVTYHTLRHSFATHLAEKGKSMKDIAAYLGDDISTTEKHYIAFSPADDGVIDCL